MKTKKIKRIAGLLLFIIHFLFFIPLKAQSDTTGAKRMCNELMKNQFIFEGKVISSHSGLRIKGSDNKYYNFNSYLVQIKKVIKGNIQKGTVEIMVGINGIEFVDNGKVEHIQSSDGPGDIPFPVEGIYFCHQEVPIKDTNSPNSNSKSLEFYFDAPISNGNLIRNRYDSLILYFPSLSDFYNYIRANYGVKIEE